MWAVWHRKKVCPSGPWGLLCVFSPWETSSMTAIDGSTDEEIEDYLKRAKGKN
jgi:hypothetical protein